MRELAQGVPRTGRMMQSVDGRADHLEKRRIGTRQITKNQQLTFGHELLKTFVGLYDAVKTRLRIFR